jgi:hypothetical protein
MLKAIMLGAAVAALGCGAASAAPEVPVFDGVVKFTALNEPCLDDGWIVGDEFRRIYRSVVRPGNKAPGGLQFMGNRMAFNLLQPEGKPLPGGEVKGTFSATGLSTQVGVYRFSSPFDLVITPSKIKANSSVVTIEGTLGNFAVPGCTVTIFGVATPRL